MNSKWVKIYKLRPETIKLLEENMGEKFRDSGRSDNFLDITSKKQETKAKIRQI